MRDTPAINYNEISREYGSHRRPHPGVLEIIFELAGRMPDGPALEVGAGTGNYALRIEERHGSTVTGLDPSAAMAGPHVSEWLHIGGARASRAAAILRWSVRSCLFGGCYSSRRRSEDGRQ